MLWQVFHLAGHVNGQPLSAFDFGFHLAHCTAKLRTHRLQADTVENIIGYISGQIVCLRACTETETAKLITAKNPAFGLFAALAKAYGVSLSAKLAPPLNAFSTPAFSRCSFSRSASGTGRVAFERGSADDAADSAGFVLFIGDIY